MKGRPAGAAVSGRASLRLLALLPAGLLLAGNSLLSQTRAAGEPPVPNQFDLTLAAGERSTSNPWFYSDELSPDGDYLSDLRADLAMTRSSERTRWSLRYSPFYTRYRENTQLSTFNHTFDYDGDYDVSRRWRILLREHFAYSRDPLHVATPEGGYDPVLTPESKRWRSFSEAGVETDLSRSLVLQAAVSGRIDRFEDPTLADSETFSGRTGFLKRIGREQTVSVTYIYARFLLTGLDATGEPVRLPDYSSHGLEAGWSRAREGGAEVRVVGGASNVIREGRSETWFTGSAEYLQPFRHVDLTGTFRQNLSADTGDGAVSLSQNASVRLSSRIGRVTTLDLATGYGTRKSAMKDAAQENLAYWGVLLRGEVRLDEKLSFAGEASRRRQTEDRAAGTGSITEVTNVTGYYLGLIYRIF